MNKTLIAAIGLAVVAGGVLLTKKTGKKEKDARIFTTVSEGLEPSKVDSLVFEKDGTTKEIIRDQSNSWVMKTDENFPVDAQKIASLYDSLGKTKFIRVVAENPDDLLLKDLGMDKPGKLILSSAGKAVLSIDVGSNRDKGGQHIRFAGEKKVYLASQAVSVRVSSADWEMKRLLNLDKKLIRKVAFTPSESVNKEPVTLSRQKEGDKFEVQNLPEGKQTKISAAGDSLANLLENLNFNKRFSSDNVSAVAALEKPSKVIFTLDGGATVEVKVGVQVGEEKENPSKKYYLHISASGLEQASVGAQSQLNLTNELFKKWSFEVGSYVAQKFEKGLADFIEDKQKEEAKGEKKNDEKADG